MQRQEMLFKKTVAASIYRKNSIEPEQEFNISVVYSEWVWDLLIDDLKK